MTRGPEIWPITVASTPKFARHVTSASATRCSASAFGPEPGFDTCSRARSGSWYSVSDGLVRREQRLLRRCSLVLVELVRLGLEEDGRAARRRDPGSRGATSTGGSARRREHGDLAGLVLVERRSAAWRGPAVAARTAWPERRRIAPSEAPVRKRTPARVSRTPRIVEPVVPSPCATTPSSSAAHGAPVRATEGEHQARAAPARSPSRNGPTRDERAPRDDEHAERDRARGAPGTRPSRRAFATRCGDRAAVQPEPEHGGEEDADARSDARPISSGW